MDITLPGTRWERGRIHPLTLVFDEIIDVFWGMGFEIARGPDIEDDYHNFEALNIPQDHPARDMQDTFFVAGGKLLRTHTSPVQIRTMETRRPPLQVIVPGAVYRHDDDATHSPMFHQVEGFVVDQAIAFSDLKGVLTHFLRQVFGTKHWRFSPSTETTNGCLLGDRGLKRVTGKRYARRNKSCRPKSTILSVSHQPSEQTNGTRLNSLTTR